MADILIQGGDGFFSAYRAPARSGRGPGIVLLDTGAALSTTGRLSAVCAETGECVQVHRSGQLVEAA